MFWYVCVCACACACVRACVKFLFHPVHNETYFRDWQEFMVKVCTVKIGGQGLCDLRSTGMNIQVRQALWTILWIVECLCALHS